MGYVQTGCQLLLGQVLGLAQLSDGQTDFLIIDHIESSF